MWPFKKIQTKFQIIEYPLSGNFYVWVTKGWFIGGYIHKEPYTGTLDLEHDLYFAKKCRSIEEAECLIKLYKEQNFIEGAKIHNR